MSDKRNNSRRTFIKKSSLSALGTALSPGLITSLFANTSNNFIGPTVSIHPRYYRWYVNAGEEWLETNTDYSTLKWNIPISKVALVLVDVWQRHYIKDTEDRAEAIIKSKLIPLMTACRKAGLQIIHAPSAPVAMQHQNWVKLVNKTELSSQHESWPPKQFRNKEGIYDAYSRPVEPRAGEKESLPPLYFHPKAGPVGKEAVVSTGEELHRYCKQENILFLLYAGFNTNACILSRDYGIIQMSNRGYEVILVRDCTTGMESRYTQASLSQTNGAVMLLEMFGQYSVLSNEINMNGSNST